MVTNSSSTMLGQYTIQYNTKYFIPPYKNNLHRIVMGAGV